MIGFTLFLYAFSSHRNDKRTVEDIVIQFTDESTPFVTRDAVNKLLIQNDASVTGTPKEKLALKEMEARLNAHPIINKADIYVTMSGSVGVTIQQRKPIARLNGKTSFYIDQDGEVMPLSDNFSARVPLVIGVSKEDTKAVFELVSFIVEDEFLKKHIVGIHKEQDGGYELTPRKLGYKIKIGAVESLVEKFSNYKAFYQKAQKDKTLDNYRLINLKYRRQVVCKKV